MYHPIHERVEQPYGLLNGADPGYEALLLSGADPADVAGNTIFPEDFDSDAGFRAGLQRSFDKLSDTQRFILESAFDPAGNLLTSTELGEKLDMTTSQVTHQRNRAVIALMRQRPVAKWLHENEGNLVRVPSAPKLPRVINTYDTPTQ